EVRAARARAALERLPGHAATAAPAHLLPRVPGRDGALVLGAAARAVAVARGARLLGSHDPDPGRTSVSVLALGLAAGPREGHPRPAPRPGRARGAAGGWGARALALAAPPLAAPAGRLHCRAARRLRARADALVLPLPAVVLPVRRDRVARGAPAR